MTTHQDLRARFDAWLKAAPEWAPEFECHRAWVESFAWWAVRDLAAIASTEGEKP